MDRLTIAATGGLRSRMESLSLLANNLANAGTTGFKTDREFYNVYTSEEADGAGQPVSTLPMIQKPWTDFSPGVITPTGNALDIAISGPGFITVTGPSGPLYTRSGNLQVSPAGKLSADGFPVRSTTGEAIPISPGITVDIATDGTVRQAGNTLGRIAIAEFRSTASLQKLKGACFQNNDPKNVSTVSSSSEVLQGSLEGSNVVVPEAAMRLVGVMRQFEMLQKAISMGIEMNSKAIQEVARVSS
jgi:flagellar basal body rod protein FlgG